jgi:hypothetical protein
MNLPKAKCMHVLVLRFHRYILHGSDSQARAVSPCQSAYAWNTGLEEGSPARVNIQGLWPVVVPAIKHHPNAPDMVNHIGVGNMAEDRKVHHIGQQQVIYFHIDTGE